jgi:hypothetical protein
MADNEENDIDENVVEEDENVSLPLQHMRLFSVIQHSIHLL